MCSCSVGAKASRGPVPLQAPPPAPASSPPQTEIQQTKRVKPGHPQTAGFEYDGAGLYSSRSVDSMPCPLPAPGPHPLSPAPPDLWLKLTSGKAVAERPEDPGEEEVPSSGRGGAGKRKGDEFLQSRHSLDNKWGQLDLKNKNKGTNQTKLSTLDLTAEGQELPAVDWGEAPGSRDVGSVRDCPHVECGAVSSVGAGTCLVDAPQSPSTAAWGGAEWSGRGRDHPSAQPVSNTAAHTYQAGGSEPGTDGRLSGEQP